MKLQDTIELMNSSDFKDRFKAEYYQLKIRLDGLKKMLKNTKKELWNLLQIVIMTCFLLN